MDPQYYEWTCSVCSLAWVLQTTSTAYMDMSATDARYAAGSTMGYPNCVNEVYGCMSSQCMINALAAYGLTGVAKYVTFDEAYAIMAETTGTINPQGMYHFMGIRGVTGSSLWVANSAQGYRGIGETMDRSQFNSLGPVELIYLVPS
jgi:hypothetical protein